MTKKDVKICMVRVCRKLSEDNLFFCYALVHPATGKFLGSQHNGVTIVCDPSVPRNLIIGITDPDFLDMAIEEDNIAFRYFADKLTACGVAVCEI